MATETKASKKSKKKERSKQVGEVLKVFGDLDVIRIVQGGEINILAEATKGLAVAGELGAIELGGLFEDFDAVKSDGGSSSSSSDNENDNDSSGEDGDPTGASSYYQVFKEDRSTQLLRVADVTSKKSPEKLLLIVTRPSKKNPLMYIAKRQEAFWVFDTKKRKIGNIRRNRFEGAINYELIISDNNNNPLLSLHSSIFRSANTFFAKTPNKSKSKGKLVRKFSVTSFFSTSCDEYKVYFPEGADARLKTLFFAATVVVDVIFHGGSSIFSNLVTATTVATSVGSTVGANSGFVPPMPSFGKKKSNRRSQYTQSQYGGSQFGDNVREAISKMSDISDVPEVAKIADVANVAEIAKVADIADVAEIAKVADIADVAEIAKVADIADVAEIAKVAEITNVDATVEVAGTVASISVKE
eukprot:TRINITY_DN53_c0_g1_i1.p1 TRINITY_DN53_c0_g1~~TRINITY_DN53_c0_g1_i1.p1  ORF type:complete len:415 (-),score=185.66 TRINITY_DN53_c0_g1_i1:87-1331(-)